MLRRALFLAVLILPWSALPWCALHAANDSTAEQMQACKDRQPLLARQAEQFQGDERMKRLIEADLRRASREETESDGDECLEALDHAAKLLAGDI